MIWSELTVHTTTFGAELVSDVFFEMGANGVVVEDRNDVLRLLSGDRVWDYVDDELLEKTSPVALVKGFVQKELEAETKRELERRLAELRTREEPDYPLGSLEIITRDISDEDWANVWKKHYRPISFRSVVICPEWIDYRKKPGETVVKIDPGMAFGTGEHETTGMCISLMQDFDLLGKDVLDVGCGSGILGMTALALGAASGYMVDFDPVAVSATKHNLGLNGLLERAEVKCGNLLTESDVTGDVVFANITADVLIALSKDLPRYVRRGGAVILSGLIHKRADEVVSAYESAGFTLKKRVSQGEWEAASLTK